MTNHFSRLPFLVALPALIVVAMAAGPSSQGDRLPARFTAAAINMDPTVQLKATLVDITVSRWTADAERKQLIDLLAKQGQPALQRAVHDLPRVGTIKTPDTLSYDLRYARRIPGEDGGEQIILMTDREIAIWEKQSMSRTVDYPFMVIELRLDQDGHGEGKLTVAAKLGVNKVGQIVMENYGTQPVRLSNVKREADRR